ncbi:MAG: alpha-L-arabinofuranosidase [Muribaculaceae bacterium]|nr:alpha-L-arabinofuranosidase [Muribaculaceae bacterium]
MNKTILLAAAMVAVSASAQTPADSVDVLAYSSITGEGGMRLAWRPNAKSDWQPIYGHSFVSSDFGPWGSYKKMFAPCLSRTADGWMATWVADQDGYVLATAQSPDLMRWLPQTYTVQKSHRDRVGQYSVDGKAVMGSELRMSRAEVDSLKAFVERGHAAYARHSETMAGDAERFAGLEPFVYSIKADPKGRKHISDMLIGIFFEDINYAADGGLYAELIQNRDFEYQPSDRGNDWNWNALTAWSMPRADKGSAVIATTNPIHANNPHYLSVDARPGFQIVNGGWDGIALNAAENYDLNFKARGNAKIKAELVDANGNSLAAKTVDVTSEDWADYAASFMAGTDVDGASLVLTVVGDGGKFDLDMVSLFPRSTFKGRNNGLRADLAQTLADLPPRFVRFPGGCVAHGDGIDNIYDWKGSVGPLEARRPLRNLWGYHQTRGLGYYEYFQFCEDIGAEPLPVLAAGVPCQNSGTAAHHSHDALTTRGQQCGIPMEEMDAYIQDVLDLIEWANGPADSRWGRVRAEAGHPEPFGLKYIGIGNEDMITPVFEERFRMIYDAVAKAYPDVKVVGTVGPFYEGADYDEGWRLARELDIPYVDEHYYVSPGWMIYNQDYYDDYQRGGTQVYLGEYAAHLDGRPSNIETALAEALYLTSVERNADVVAMTSYAPLFSKDGHTQWRPDLIYFNNSDVRPSVDYYVQQLYGQNSGDEYIPAQVKSTVAAPVNQDKAEARVASSIVYDSRTGEYILKVANLLPVSYTLKADLSKLGIPKRKSGKMTVLSGAPADSDVFPASSDMNFPSNGILQVSLPAYSFAVFRF